MTTCMIDNKQSSKICPPRKRQWSIEEFIKRQFLWFIEHDLCKQGDACLYRSYNHNNGCAIGITIPDIRYKSSYEECGYLDIHYEIENLFEPKLRPHLEEIQNIHDASESNIQYLQRLIEYCLDSEIKRDKKLMTWLIKFIRDNEIYSLASHDLYCTSS